MEIKKIKEIKKASFWGKHYNFQSWIDEIEATYPCIKDMTAKQIAVMIDYGFTRESRGEMKMQEWHKNNVF